MKKFVGLVAAIAVVFGITAMSAYAAQITEAQAKDIALKHAGVAADQAQFTKMKIDRDFGRVEYELEFYVGSTEYDYDIDAATGQIRQFSREEHMVAPLQNNGGAAAPQGGQGISEQKAKEIALARVPGATMNDIRKFKLDYDDGMRLYEGEIFYNFREYEFEINADTGEIVSWEID